MRADKKIPGNRIAAILAAIFGICATPAAFAAVGVNFSASSGSEEYVYANARKSIDSTRVTVSPNWSNDDWKVSLDVPFIKRDARASGTYTYTGPLGVVHTFTGSATESDSGLGDMTLHATRFWQPREILSTYVGAHVRLPTGDPNSSPGSVLYSTRYMSAGRSYNDYSLGQDGADLRVAPGATVSNEYVWATIEPAYVVTTTTGGENRPAAYLGIGFTPVRYIELSAEFDYEDPSTAGGSKVEQTTFTVAFRHLFNHLGISVSTWQDDNVANMDSNLSVGLQWY